MNKVLNVIIILITVFAFSQTQVLAQTRERSEVSAKYKWKLEDLYASDEAWNKAKQELAAQFDEVTRYQGKLASSASELLACLEFDSRISREFGRLYSYAHMKSDEDTRNSEYLAMQQEMQQLGVYMALIENVTDNLDSFGRYLNLKKRMLGVETLKYSDVYAPVVKGIDLKYTFDEAKELVLDSVKPLGSSYGRVVERAFKERWIDVYPTPGNRAGGYCSGSAYDVHPYILLNYNGQYDDVSTLAHELGHAMHSYYSNKNQPYPTADYSIFVAEVASTFNEALLIDKMLEEIKDDDTRLSLLMNYLDSIKGTVFRQTQFAEFELRIHEKAERGEPLTGDVLNEIYGEILKKYYGHDKGICHIDDLYAVEWAYVPHFYYNFYVYQYSTSFTASTALAEKVLGKEKGAVGKYIEFISSGGSDYPIELLKQAGVDMTGAEPFNKTMAAMNRTMDEIEAILEKKGR